MADAEAALESREEELGRQAERIEELDRVATLLAERVVERQRELRAARAEQTLHAEERWKPAEAEQRWRKTG